MSKLVKPKFRVGQYLIERRTERPFKVASRKLQGCWCYWEDNESIGFIESELRGLTASEIGPRKARRKP